VIAWILTIAIFLLIVVGICAVHEAGHALVAYQRGIRLYECGFGFGKSLVSFKRLGFAWHWRLWPLGAYIALKDEDLYKLTPRSQIAIALGGVAVNIVIGIVLLLLFPMMSVIGLVGLLSLCLGIGNILPIYPMDGWLVLIVILRNRFNHNQPLRRLETTGGKIVGGVALAAWIVFTIATWQ